MFFKSPIDIEILFDGQESRKQVEIPSVSSTSKTLKDRYPLYEDGESVSGLVTLRVREGRKVEHLGIRVSLVGSVDTTKSSSEAKKRAIDTFLSLSADICPPGELVHSQSFPFNFKDVEKRYESYRGKNIDVMFYVKVVVLRKSTDIVKLKKFWCYLYNTIPPVLAAGAADENKPVKLDIGIENCLHIEFEYSKSQYALKDVIVGRIYFLLTRLKVKHMEISLIKRETCGHEPNQLSDTTSIRYEIMDGSPVKGETIPIRLFLGGYDLTPNITSNYFSVKNYLSLVIIDEDGRRYFKQTEIILYRTLS
ncbi:AEL178Cp [Eremothecium gossypii ATCC 10895]|uniref:AEL178Cp n=1 Tax=Eremothecium gossypii (strain ATCC 10895 / CBS 109.51 / FGSC 9923 / NRRL Y-1056) TaxID=284811 RepID=Q758D0_EREGS|nr:AEL178Cp [Eremothecium gossypii ATCC 10895]AAS52507.1 AEL178Cp [Eremothecium gossypii ATCC 10895]AEY96807.1 FAEL178Cp [Eremothecium gossypii FDAG1]